MMRHLRGKMIAFVGLPTLIIYVVILGVTMLQLRGQAREDVEREMTRLADNYAARFDDALEGIAGIARSSARFMEIAPDLGEDRLIALLSANTNQNLAVYGAAIAFEPGTYKPGDELVSPYVHRHGDGLTAMNIGREVYDWYGDERWQWWHLPKKLGRGAWTDPYFDEGAGNVLMVTFSEPFTREGKFRGVATVDVMLPTLEQSVGGEILGGIDFAIINRSGQFVFSPDAKSIMQRTLFDVADALQRPDLAALGRRLLTGESGTATVEGWDSAERTLVFFAPIESTGWSFLARMPERAAFAQSDARAASATIALAGTLALIIACIWFVSGRITRPIQRLRAKVLEIAGGNLDARIDDITSRDEIGDLAGSFNQMSAELRDNLNRLALERTAREKRGRDLELAREIQRGLLPATPPRIPGFEIAGWNRAAEETGGDFFDWLELPDGRTIVTLADVTGHGIGPALIVAACRAYLRASTSAGTTIGLAEAMGRVNDLLHRDMTDGRFVTAVVGIIDAARSEVTLLSAGQAPILFFEREPGIVQTWAADAPPLGVMLDLPMDEPRVIRFKRGDALIMVTDGFFEWQNASGEQFGIRRLEEFVARHHLLAPGELIERLYHEVVAASDGTEQADDATALVIRRA